VVVGAVEAVVEPEESALHAARSIAVASVAAASRALTACAVRGLLA
jgi:hypothetical protein